jgi:hypothetical protein
LPAERKTLDATAVPAMVLPLGKVALNPAR